MTYICKNRKSQVGNRQSKIDNRKSVELAFTLVELLVVIAVISLLLSILVPSLGKARSMAKRTVCAHNLKQIDLAFNMYLDGNNDTYPCANDAVARDSQGKWKIWLWMGRGWRKFVEPFFGGIIDANNPSVLFCPQDDISKDNYESTSYAYSMTFYHSPAQINDIGSPYGIIGVSDPNNPRIESVRQRVFDVANPSGKILIGEWNSHHLKVAEKGLFDKESGWWCWEGSRNFLFADGHVLYLPATQIRATEPNWPDANLTIDGIKGCDWPPLKIR